MCGTLKFEAIPMSRIESTRTIIATITCLILFLTSGNAQSGPYSLTVFADGGAHGTSGSQSLSQQSSSGGSDFGHVFVELTNGDRHIYMGYYGDPHNPSRGQLRVDADLASKRYWDFYKTYPITETGYHNAQHVIDTWGTEMGTWKLWRNCGDFAEAIANAAGVDLQDVPKELGLNTPRSWAGYLRDHGGVPNPQRSATPLSQTPAGLPQTGTLPPNTACDEKKRADIAQRECGCCLIGGGGYQNLSCYASRSAYQSCISSCAAVRKTCGK